MSFVFAALTAGVQRNAGSNVRTDEKHLFWTCMWREGRSCRCCCRRARRDRTGGIRKHLSPLPPLILICIRFRNLHPTSFDRVPHTYISALALSPLSSHSTFSLTRLRSRTNRPLLSKPVSPPAPEPTPATFLLYSTLIYTSSLLCP